ncbi:MAG: pilus assembly protein [Hyphomonas sp.]|uniref:pilus assembly protein N-terminal domain-containing protein n=1 Tax=Hyphomonas TaxID=85 RepID=UPI000B6DD890|nr:pilus assembly protein N-terminal domain-containing protein [Hyphomonas sp.]MAH92076.1 pilus assembly protein [Hyphomonas sp.]OUX89140.1 MAG: hypothetical protein CBB91_02705 [Hyphomonas sp. TMED31]
MRMFSKMCTLSMVAVGLGQAAIAGPLSVELNKTIPVHLRGTAASVVLGSPSIADVAVHDENLLFVTGKSFGTTNLLVFDKAGRQIYSSDIVVVADEANLVTVNRSGSNFTYDCVPNCRPTISVGDDSGHFDEQIQQRIGVKQITDD